MMEGDSRWDVAAYVSWSEESGAVTYEWEQGYFTY
jgi:hypothetical protein